MTCPIASNCFQTVQELYNTSSMLFDDYVADLAQVKITIEGERPDETTQRLRAFYVVEVIYRYLIPSSVNLTDVDFEGLFDEEFDRSEEGLDELLEALNEAQRLLRVETGELELLGREENPGMEMLVGILDAPERVVSNCAKLATHLKTVLKSHKSLDAYGIIFAECMRDVGFSISQCLDQLQILLSITPHNPVQPWNTTNSFQV